MVLVRATISGSKARSRIRTRPLPLDEVPLYGVATSELNAPDSVVRERAPRAKDFVEVLVRGKEVIVNTHMDRKDKYGRGLAVIYWRNAEGT